ncbi:hypothetical protein Salat_0849000 [Sesamum alatum]|uniref:RING-type E3 ubiquitin transferase n=1 Tax=Sesamum alatum TaxID=300844 RepID=A0AAE1YIT4_9LAMI|nr:hypothetical protein Salat_0849000 [Sesamum alatum]
MSAPNAKGSSLGRRGGRNGLVAVAIDKDKGSQHALKWAVDNLLDKGQTVVLIHVLLRSSMVAYTYVTFIKLFCRVIIRCFDVVLEDTDIAKAIKEYVARAAIEYLVLGDLGHGFIR